ncbi:N-acetylmuramoyl-L-alanine amidase [Aequorivita sublithincola DSM 14238]|uniref:N-acetylmuramoyl-L-alanine amidase n=1 Tax=Aequorivita sublithincola (strain DSM 14238 / LMG 21431 / ACAM 643 / 9-3) TaxID=746697 RepID=I3YU80_AEQSU|nr:N-acetylmuramoyl-L-alanine amidase [Aequorivita sublithincola]AFL80548.1 N-acetylmuramoyl-L-alanine amidase [Aequorivita sublithincola DSM 14238]
MRNDLRILGFAFLLFTFSFSYARDKIVVIDVSHGGKDNGYESDGHKEKDIAFEIALKIVALNKLDNVKIILTREGDYFVSLKDRLEFINALNPDYVLSLHINSNDDTEVSGFDFFVSTQINNLSEKSNRLAQSIESSIPKEFSSNGIKNANFSILKNVEAPITLIEMGYLSNPKDKLLLTSAESQDKIAQAIYNAIK